MGKIKGNEPAMPIISEEMTSRYATTPHSMLMVQFQGLTIRQQFAAMAMQGLIASTDWTMSQMNDVYQKATVKYAVEMADALIAELNKESEVTND